MSGGTVAVAGASGYAGGELLRLLASHPEFEVVAVAAGGKAGQPVSAVHPQLIGTGLAGYGLAREFRKHDSDTPLILITAAVAVAAAWDRSW